MHINFDDPNEVFNSIIAVDTDWKNITNSGLPANAYVSAFWYFYTFQNFFSMFNFNDYYILSF